MRFMCRLRGRPRCMVPGHEPPTHDSCQVHVPLRSTSPPRPGGKGVRPPVRSSFAAVTRSRCSISWWPARRTSSVTAQTGGHLVLQRALPNAVLAEASVFSDRYHCDGVAVAPTRTLAVARSSVRTLLASGPGLPSPSHTTSHTSFRRCVFAPRSSRFEPSRSALTPGSPGTAAGFRRAAPGRRSRASSGRARGPVPGARQRRAPGLRGHVRSGGSEGTPMDQREMLSYYEGFDEAAGGSAAVSAGGGSQGWPASAVQMRRSSPRSDVSVVTLSRLHLQIGTSLDSPVVSRRWPRESPPCAVECEATQWKGGRPAPTAASEILLMSHILVVVTRTSYPSSSALSISAPLSTSDQPLSAAVSTECSARCRRRGIGVP